MLIDSHTHLFASHFDEDRNAVVRRAREAGVGKMLLPNIDASTIEAMHAMADGFPGHCLPMMGLHPSSVKANFQEELETVRKWLFESGRKYIAVGECGIDLYWDKTYIKEQESAFRTQIQWAKKLELPIVIHVRESFDEVFAILDEMNDEGLRGVFHCFSGTVEQAVHIIGYGGFKMGIGGTITFKNGKIDQFLDQLDIHHFILETDSPYLAPVPHRGKRNESAYIRLVAEKMSQVFDVSIEEVEYVTTNTCKKLFNLDDK